MTGSIPVLDAAPLFAPDGAARRHGDAALRDAAAHAGFAILVGLPAWVPLGEASRRDLLRIFALPESEKRPLWRRAAAPENPQVYRGYFPLQSGIIKEGIDIGPDRDPGEDASTDVLAEPTPWPDEARLPGWRAGVMHAFGALERVGRALMGSLARGLSLPESTFDEAFRDGSSTLRLIRYPTWPALATSYGLTLRPLDTPEGAPRRFDIGGEHVDSGLVTLLQQDEVGGLQARLEHGAWVDVPFIESSLVVNFGKLLERWTGDRIRATEHRVLGNEVTRCSIPFFFEPRIDARIAPLPLDGVEPFEPFRYGDHLWTAMTRFSEFEGLERWRDPVTTAVAPGR